MNVFAHRGNIDSPNKANENTMQAFEQVIINPGIHGIELDVDQTDRGTLIVYHRTDDEESNHLTCDELLKKKGQVNHFDAILKSVKDSLGNNKRRKKFILDIEIKKYKGIDYAADYEKRIVDTVLAHFEIDEFLLTSFSSEVLLKVKLQTSQVKTGRLLPKKTTEQEIESLSVKKDADNICPHYKLFKKYRNLFLRIGKPIYVYKVKETDILNCLNDPAIYGVITDYAENAARTQI
jgi:glycerophosphoryl diester phosphodiesterase